MKTFISWSGGKDSTASIILAYEHGVHIDGVVFSEVMFDQSRNISGENPTQIKWIYETAIPIIEKQFGFKVYVLRDKSDYIKEFNHIVTRSKIPERNGKKTGWLLGGMCVANDRLKMRPLKKFFKQVGEHEQIVGIAYDETQRIERLKKYDNKWSILDKYGITEEMTFDICKKYNLLSPIYKMRSRGGCWFCPNASIKELASVKKQYPELWHELEILSHDKDVISNGFKYGKPFWEVDKEIDMINSQMTIFDI